MNIETNYFFINLIDKTLCIILLIMLGPILLVVLLLQFFFNKKEIFFMSERVGHKNKLFELIKFRTMKKNSNDEVTRIGKFLRRTSIDELPQLINVLKGDMSIVGPRPFPKHLFDDIKKNDLILRHSVKPGMTGYCQINFTGKKRLLDEKISQDIYFVKNYSILLYLSIIIKTPQILFKRYINNLTGKSL